jgi:hypothetical protein
MSIQQPNLRRRSLAELDDVIDEIMERNPEFVEKLTKIIEEQRNKNAKPKRILQRKSIPT